MKMDQPQSNQNDEQQSTKIHRQPLPEERMEEWITGHIDMHIRGVTVRQFSALNENLKKVIDGMRAAGELGDHASFEIMAKGKEPDPILDEIDSFHRRIHDMDDSLIAGAINYEEYAAQLRGVMKGMRSFIEANTFAMTVTTALKEESQAKAETHFSPEQQATE
jgi:hypothetical protein